MYSGIRMFRFIRRRPVDGGLGGIKCLTGLLKDGQITCSDKRVNKNSHRLCEAGWLFLFLRFLRDLS